MTETRRRSGEREIAPPRAAAVALVCTALFATSFVFYFALFRDLPVGIEARDFLHHGGIKGFSYDASHVFGFARSANRTVSMISFREMAGVCDYRALCVNTIEISFISIAGLLLLVHLVQVSRRLAPSALAATLWCFSLPVLSTARWQATNHDKLALIFSLLALICAYGLLRKRGLVSILASNLLLLPLFALALGSKESAFHLVVTVPALLLLFSPRQGLGRLAELSRVALPLSWSAVYLGVYFSRLSSQFQAHTLSGDLLQNLGVYAHTFANIAVRPQAGLASSGPVAMATLAALFALLLVGAPVVLRESWRALRDEGADTAARRQALVLAYLAVFLTSALAIVLRSRAKSPFYVYTPACGFFALVVFGGRSLLLGGGRRRAAIVTAASVAVIGILAAGFASNFRESADVRTFLESTWNASAGYRGIRETLSCEPGAVYHFVLPARFDVAAFLFDHRDESKDLILSFVFEEPCEADIRFPPPEKAGERVGGQYYVEFDRYQTLQGIWRGDERLL